MRRARKSNLCLGSRKPVDKQQRPFHSIPDNIKTKQEEALVCWCRLNRLQSYSKSRDGTSRGESRATTKGDLIKTQLNGKNDRGSFAGRSGGGDLFWCWCRDWSKKSRRWWYGRSPAMAYTRTFHWNGRHSLLAAQSSEYKKSVALLFFYFLSHS